MRRRDFITLVGTAAAWPLAARAQDGRGMRRVGALLGWSGEATDATGGNITGFINEVAAMGGKWLLLLREIAPRFTRAAIMFNPDTAPGAGAYFLGSFEDAAAAMMAESVIARVHSDAEIESAVSSLGPNAALVMMTDSFMGVHRRAVAAAALRHKVPTIFDTVGFVREGGLLSYGFEVERFARPGRAQHAERAPAIRMPWASNATLLPTW